MTPSNLKNRVQELVNEVETTHRYSMSRIYGLYNEIFETNEKPQSCASCLIRKLKELKIWFQNQEKVEELIGEEGKSDDTNLPEEQTPKAERKKHRNGSKKD